MRSSTHDDDDNDSYLHAKIRSNVSDFQNKLSVIFSTSSDLSDFSLFQGYLTFVHSRCESLLSELIERVGKSDDTIKLKLDAQYITSLIDFVWYKIHYPIYKWFQFRSKQLASATKDARKTTNLKKLKIYSGMYIEMVTQFNLSVSSLLTNKYDMHEILPTNILGLLNTETAPRTLNDDNKKIHVHSATPISNMLLIVLHKCLLNLGTAMRYNVAIKMNGKRSSMGVYKKSLDTLDLAIKILPCWGDAFLQKGLISIKTDDFSFALYNFLRGSLCTFPSETAIANVKLLLVEAESTLNRQLLKRIAITLKNEYKGSRADVRDVLRFSFMALLGFALAPGTWKDPRQGNKLVFDEPVKRVEFIMFNKLSASHEMNLHVIMQNMLIGIGLYDYSIKILKTVKHTSERVLGFIFTYCCHVLKNVIHSNLQKSFNDYHYLAMARIMMCWLRTNKDAFQYAISNREFCEHLADFLNEFSVKKLLDVKKLSKHRPKRAYYFEEDCELNDFKSIDLCDFKDTFMGNGESLFELQNNLVNSKTKLSKNLEHDLRLRAIYIMGKKILNNNQLGLLWDESSLTFVWKRTTPSISSSVYLRKAQEQQAQTNENTGYKQQRGNSGRKSETPQFDKTIIRSKKNAISSTNWGYSGSSLDSGPQSLSVKPSSVLLEEIRPRNLVFEANSYRPNSVSSNLSSSSGLSQVTSDLKQMMVSDSHLSPAFTSGSKVVSPNEYASNEDIAILSEEFPPTKHMMQPYPAKMEKLFINGVVHGMEDSLNPKVNVASSAGEPQKIVHNAFFNPESNGRQPNPIGGFGSFTNGQPGTLGREITNYNLPSSTYPYGVDNSHELAWNSELHQSSYGVACQQPSICPPFQDSPYPEKQQL